MQPTTSSNFQPSPDDTPLQPSIRKYSVSQKSHLFSCFKPQTTSSKKPSTSTQQNVSHQLAHDCFSLEGGMKQYKICMEEFIKMQDPIQYLSTKARHESIKANILTVSDDTELSDEAIQAYVKLESCMNCQLLHYLPAPPSSVGICITEARVTVGTVSREGVPETIVDISGDISFLEGEILIGSESSERNSLSLYSLIKSSVSDRNTIIFETLDFTFTAEETLTLFFLKLFELLREKINTEVIQKAVISIPFIVSNSERKRVERAGKVFQSVTVVSTLLSASLDYARQTGFFLRLRSDISSKFILIFQFHQDLFSIALFEIGHNFVFAKKFVKSTHIRSSINPSFVNSHARLIAGEEVGKEDLGFVRKVYSKAVIKVCKGTKRSNISAVVVSAGDGSSYSISKVLEVLRKVFSNEKGDDTCNIFVSEEPLRSASLWSFSSVASSFVLPSDVDIYDVFYIVPPEVLGSVTARRKPAKLRKSFKLAMKFKRKKSTSDTKICNT